VSTYSMSEKGVD
jgi:hypothetical protein